jgi:hypothetical protein
MACETLARDAKNKPIRVRFVRATADLLSHEGVLIAEIAAQKRGTYGPYSKGL